LDASRNDLIITGNKTEDMVPSKDNGKSITEWFIQERDDEAEDVLNATSTIASSTSSFQRLIHIPTTEKFDPKGIQASLLKKQNLLRVSLPSPMPGNESETHEIAIDEEGVPKKETLNQ
jgi:hypothetical protein